MDPTPSTRRPGLSGASSCADEASDTTSEDKLPLPNPVGVPSLQLPTLEGTLSAWFHSPIYRPATGTVTSSRIHPFHGRRILHEKMRGKSKARGAAAANAVMGANDAPAKLALASFTADTAKRTGRSERAIQWIVQRAARNGHANLVRVTETSLNQRAVLDTLPLLPLATGGEPHSAGGDRCQGLCRAGAQGNK